MQIVYQDLKRVISMRQRFLKRACLILVFVLILSGNVFAKEVPYTLEDRDRLIRVEARLAEIDKRFEDFNKRFESLERQIDRLVMIFTALVVCIIGFALWDRRTMIRPFEDKVKVIEKRLDANERAIKEIDPSKVNNLIEALKDLAKTD